jgi:hypothetical protein
MGNSFDNENRRILNEWRKRLNDDYQDSDTEQNNEAVPYTMQDELMQSITETAKKQFGADFSKVENPMLYYPESGDVEVNGLIATLDDAKFQFRYKNSECNIWTNNDNPLKLNDENVRTLGVIWGVYKNWKKELGSAEDYKPMSMRNGDIQQNDMQQGGNMVPGDDF